MEISYKGANCAIIKDKDILIVVDPTQNCSIPEVNDSEAVVLLTNSALDSKIGDQAFVIDMPGEYEHHDVSVRGIATRAYLTDDEKSLSATMYQIKIRGLTIAVIGHTPAPLSDASVEEFGEVDIVIIPVGGGGTLDAVDAATIIKQLSPRVVIPTHFDDGQTNYQVPQNNLSLLEKEMGVDNIERQTVYKLKNNMSLPAATTVYELTRTK